MTPEEITALRQQAHNLCHDPSYGPQDEAERAKLAYNIRVTLIKETGWSRGKKMENGKYSYLEQ